MTLIVFPWTAGRFDLLTVRTTFSLILAAAVRMLFRLLTGRPSSDVFSATDVPDDRRRVYVMAVCRFRLVPTTWTVCAFFSPLKDLSEPFLTRSAFSAFEELEVRAFTR